MGRLAWFLCSALAVGGSCRGKQKAAGNRFDAAAQALPVGALQIASRELTRLEIAGPGQEPFVLEPGAEGWRIVEPISYRASDTVVDSVLAVLAEIEIQRQVAASPSSRHRLGETAGIVVRAWRGDAITQFTIGASVGEETYVQREGESRVYAVRGRCRRIFEVSLDRLRDPTILDLAIDSIERVVFSGPQGRLALIPDGKESGRFEEEVPRLKNFYAERASKSVAVLTKLFAKGFLDLPYDREATGLFAPDTAQAQIFLRGQPSPLVVHVGHRSESGRLFLRTSRSDQVFLVSGHLGSSLMPNPELLERSDEAMRQGRRAIHARESRDDDDEGSRSQAAHNHEHGSSLPTRVPPELMAELRAMATEQRGKSALNR